MEDSVIILDSIFPNFTTDEIINHFQDVIEHQGDEWILWNQDKTEILGRHKTKDKAIAQEVAIQVAKRKEKVKGIDGDVLPISAYEKDLDLDELEIIQGLD